MLIFAPVRQAILIAFALAASLLIAQQAHAQTSISISGHVKDGNGAPLSDVTITVQSSAPTATTNTDSSGNYSFTNVPAGPGTTVTVTASRPGYLFSPRRYEYQHERDNKIANFTGGQPTR
jgi:protocatechuate 3,4-dioxygenase beta subunit